MKKLLHYILPAAFLLLHLPGKAQSNLSYTSGNSIFISLEGNLRSYTYTSKALLVNFNNNTQQLECILNLASLTPTSDSVPAAMAYDVLFGAKFPELLIRINVPNNKTSPNAQSAQTLNTRVSIRLQGITNETVVPVQFAPDENALLFSTTLDLDLRHFKASIPEKYLPLLTGKLRISIRNAHWANPPIR